MTSWFLRGKDAQKSLVTDDKATVIPYDYLWKSGFGYRDIVKCDGEFFL